MTEPSCDVAVIGGGIVGLATAMTLQQRASDLRVVVLEAERDISMHQSGHNSGVLHSGIYYKPGSVKATTCRSGKRLMEQFCGTHQIAWDRCGKIVVATNAGEIEHLEAIAERANQNGVSFERIDTDQLREIEPHVAGLAGLRVPEAGIVKYRDVCRAMVRVIEEAGGIVHRSFDVVEVDVEGASAVLKSRDGRVIRCDRFIGCGGLRSDRLFALSGGQADLQIVPFRGEYYDLTHDSEHLCRNLIYPVPDPSFPFLGVHFTRMIDGGVECGPNAVLAMSRSGYSWKEWSLRDIAQTVGFGGFRKLALKHWKMGAGEVHRSLRKNAFVAALQKLIPSIRAEHLKPGRAGVRAQAVTPDGELFDDFLIEPAERSLHVLNAPSPGATASLAIAGVIVDRFGLHS